jgi:hypothetical protein
MSLPINNMFHDPDREHVMTSNQYIDQIKRIRGYASVTNQGDNGNKFYYDTTERRLVWADGYNTYYDMLHGYYNTVEQSARNSATIAKQIKDCLVGYYDSSGIQMYIETAKDYGKVFKFGEKYDASGNIVERKEIDCTVGTRNDNVINSFQYFDSEENQYTFKGVDFKVNARSIRKHPP